MRIGGKQHHAANKAIAIHRQVDESESHRSRRSLGAKSRGARRRFSVTELWYWQHGGYSSGAPLAGKDHVAGMRKCSLHLRVFFRSAWFREQKIQANYA